MDGEWLTVSAWATRLGISRQAGHQAVRRLGIELRDGRLHAAHATAIYEAMTRPRVRVAGRQPNGARGKDAPAGRVSYDEARRRQAVADALKAERAEALQRGELISTAAVRAALARRLLATREALLQVPSRMAAVLAAETDLHRVHALLQAEMIEVFSHIGAATGDLPPPPGEAEAAAS